MVGIACNYLFCIYMTLLDIKRIIRSGFISFWRNGIVSVASLLVTTITLSVIAGLILLQAVLHISLEQIENKVDVTIYMTTDAAENKITDIKASLEQLPEVKTVTYVSAAEALDNFKNRHQDDFLTLQALEELGQNPLGATLNVKAKDPSQYESIAKFLDTEQAKSDAGGVIDKINYHQNKIVIDRLNSIIAGARELGLLLTIVFVAISIIITFTTIRLTIYFTREEIGVMRLVGAENKYIRGPFMVEGILYGTIASILTIVAFLPLTYWLGRNMTEFLGMNLFDYFIRNLLQVFAIVLVSGILLGAISSFLAVRKYLRK